MAVSQTEAVEREVRIAARPETVFEFFTDPEKHALWMGRKVDLDPRPGGIYDVEISDRSHALGEFVEVEPPSRIAFTFGWDGSEMGAPPGSGRVEVTLEPDGGGTLVRLRHTGLPQEIRGMHGEGWEHYLARLEIAAAGGDPGPDPHAAGDRS